MSDTRYIMYSSVKAMREANGGWYVWLDGSRESIFLGEERPQLEVGDPIKISIEKVVEHGRQ